MDADQAKAIAGAALGALTKLATDKVRELGASSVEGQMANGAVHALAWLASIGADAAIAAAVSRDYTSDTVEFIDEA
tara:strand:+ start:2016 stop:2246 length:231 start_codon:yes stop_codon:yes gene_type:complete